MPEDLLHTVGSPAQWRDRTFEQSVTTYCESQSCVCLEIIHHSSVAHAILWCP